jgi:DNA-binding NtrC family response regulator/predicted hydrocarbon binding protein
LHFAIAHFKSNEQMMLASDLSVDELVEFRDGSLSLHGRRLVLHDIHAFAHFRKDLLEMVGVDHTRRILTRFGSFTGQADAAAMQRLFKWDSMHELLRAGPRMHSVLGMAENTIRLLEFAEDGPEFHMELEWRNSGEAEEHLRAVGAADHAVCWMLMGYFSGYASYCLGRDIFFIEGPCRAKGDPFCVATGRNREAWAEQLNPYLKYYQVENIVGHIEELSREVKAKNLELARQEQQVASTERAHVSGGAEVRSKAYAAVLEMAAAVAPYDTTVLIRGESGVGKEVLARRVHALSHRATGPFIAVNCAALTDSLLESELFGHRAGAFTGASHDRIGIFEEASGGTLLLDEIGEISAAMQVRLLRVLQEREVVRVGENRPRKFDARVIAATSRDLETDVRNGRFREDLLYRLRVLEITIPPLRDRSEDIVPLARHFLAKISARPGGPKLKVDPCCWDVLVGYSWPGNVRELENVIERAVVFARGGKITHDCLPAALLGGEQASALSTSGEPRTLAEVEARHIQRVLAQTNHNRLLAARILDISPSTLWRKLKGSASTVGSPEDVAKPDQGCAT